MFISCRSKRAQLPQYGTVLAVTCSLYALYIPLNLGYWKLDSSITLRFNYMVLLYLVEPLEVWLDLRTKSVQNHKFESIQKIKNQSSRSDLTEMINFGETDI